MSSTTGILAFDTTNNHYRKLVCNTSGELKVEQSGSATLPTNASTLTEQQTQTTHLSAIDTTLSSFTCDTSAVTVSSSALPSGASTLAEQQSQTTHLATVAGDTTSLDSKVVACDTGAVVVSSSALPSGASTLAEQQSQTTHLATIAAKTIDTSAIAGTVSIQGDDAGTARDIAVDAHGHLEVKLVENENHYDQSWANASIGASAVSSTVDVSSMTHSTLVIEDTDYTSTDTYMVEISSDGSKWYYYDTLYPYDVRGTSASRTDKRTYDLHGVANLRVTNMGTSKSGVYLLVAGCP